MAQFQKTGTEASVTLEIYDMGNGTNAFGIFSVERFPENKVVDVGTLGYIEGEVLNFIVGKEYVKIMSFDSGDGTPAVLDAFARKVAGKAGEKGALPPLLSVFPRDGIIANSEKYILRNVMGFEFLRNGYMASYKARRQSEFECFIIEADKGRDPAALLKQLLDFYAKNGQPAGDIPLGHHVRNKYGQNLYIGVAGRFLCGVNRLPDGAGTIGDRYLRIPGRVAERAFLRGQDPRTIAGVADLETMKGAVPVPGFRGCFEGRSATAPLCFFPGM